jgi:hypothetical protein
MKKIKNAVHNLKITVLNQNQEVDKCMGIVLGLDLKVCQINSGHECV